MVNDSIGAGSTSQKEYHGYAAADKENGSRTLYVYCEELLPFVSGEIHATEAESLIKTSDGKDTYTGKVATRNFITCTYRDDSGDNTAFPPDVRKGEQVRIFNIGDTDQWYWAPTGRNAGARRLERKRIFINDTLENNADLDDDNTYFIELDSRRTKRILISTAKSDGEKYRYRLEISPVNSTVTLADDAGNVILIDSEKPEILMRNKDDSLLDLNAKNIIMACKGDMSFRADGNVSVLAGKQISLKSGLSGSSSNLVLTPSGSGTMTLSSSLSIRAKGPISIQTQGALTFGAASADFNSI